jgi:hypothetical protein
MKYIIHITINGGGVLINVVPKQAEGVWFSPGPPVSSTNKTERHDITEILLKVALNTISSQ